MTSDEFENVLIEIIAEVIHEKPKSYRDLFIERFSETISKYKNAIKLETINKIKERIGIILNERVDYSDDRIWKILHKYV